ncbi:polysaccharide pyruvyl transferase [Methylorubrum extorquens]
MKFAAFDYSDDSVFSSSNIGDEIQTIAAMNLITKTDSFVNREGLHRTTLTEPHKIIFNGWFMHRPENWPPAERLLPLLTSMHITKMTTQEDFENRGICSALDAAFSADGKEFLRKWGPVGARDLSTLELLQENDIASYFSGCLTLTLPMRFSSMEMGHIICSDVPDEIYIRIKCNSKRKVLKISHTCHEKSREKRLIIARRILELYRTASIVITSRLHGALPCLAMGVPVIFLDTAVDPYRMNGLRELLHCAMPQNILGGDFDDWFERPPSNMTSFLQLREDLINRSKAFISDW